MIIISLKLKKVCLKEDILMPNSHINGTKQYDLDKKFQIRTINSKKASPKQKKIDKNKLQVQGKCLPLIQKITLSHPITFLKISDNRQESVKSSVTYQNLQNLYRELKQLKQNEIIQLSNEITHIDQSIQKEKRELANLKDKRDGYLPEIDKLKEKLTDGRIKNYELKCRLCEAYPQLWSPYLGFNYEQFLELEEDEGFCQQQLEHLKRQRYKRKGEDERCCICLDDLKEEDFITILQCPHVHHHQCMKEWLRKKNFCPLCKRQVCIDQPKSNRKVVSRDDNNPQN